MNKFTPGPWRVAIERMGLSRSAFAVLTDGKFKSGDTYPFGICSMWNQENAEANAALVSAAPDLLDALEDAVHGVEHQHPLDADFSWVVAAKAAITKARGE